MQLFQSVLQIIGAIAIIASIVIGILAFYAVRLADQEDSEDL